ncbi:MAG: bifunctional glutamate N-acetyltransferase/amino-acid acetyltransferase ArgJ [Oleiphilus sp.]
MAVGPDYLPQFTEVPGIRLGVVEAGIRKANRKDLVLIELAAGSTCSGVFTQNAFCAAPVTLSKKHLTAGQFAQNCPAYLLINTGNANAGTGPAGMQDAVSSCQALAEQAGVPEDQVLPFSTGVIGEKLPIEKITQAMPALLASLSPLAWESAATGIMTTDTRPKGSSRKVSYAGYEISINGLSKGAGMIKPNMATMLCFIGCNAKLSQSLTNELVKELADKSFNRITIDGDTSTNDACMLFASGQTEAPEISTSHPDYPAFKSALESVFIELAQAIVKDGEGATKFVSVRIDQAESTEEALEVAYTIAHSPLIKTALYASDPNWGRILAALGRANIPRFDLDKVDIYLDDVCIVKAGGKSDAYTEEQGQRVMNQEEITIHVCLNRGAVSETVWTCDFSHDYVTINAEYRT